MEVPRPTQFKGHQKYGQRCFSIVMLSETLPAGSHRADQLPLPEGHAGNPPERSGPSGSSGHLLNTDKNFSFLLSVADIFCSAPLWSHHRQHPTKAGNTNQTHLWPWLSTFMTMTQQFLGLFLLFGAGFVARCCELKYLRWFLTNFSCCLHEKEVRLLRPFITYSLLLLNCFVLLFEI